MLLRNYSFRIDLECPFCDFSTNFTMEKNSLPTTGFMFTNYFTFVCANLGVIQCIVDTIATRWTFILCFNSSFNFYHLPFFFCLVATSFTFKVFGHFSSIFNLPSRWNKISSKLKLSPLNSSVPLVPYMESVVTNTDENAIDIIDSASYYWTCPALLVIH